MRSSFRPRRVFGTAAAAALCAATLVPSPVRAAADLSFATTASCVDGSTQLVLEIIDNDPNATTTAQIYTTDGVTDTLVTEGEFSEPNLLTVSDTGPLGIKVLGDNGATELYVSDLFDPCSSQDLDPYPATEEDPVVAGNFTITPSASCSNEGFTFSVRVQNSGPAAQITVTLSDRYGSASQQAVVGDKTFSNSDPYFGWARINVQFAGQTLYESGVRTALSEEQCGIPMPPERTDLLFDITAECGDQGAFVTLTVTGTDINVTIKGSGATSIEDTLNGDGPIQTSFSVPYDAEFALSAIDQFDRYIYDSGYRIATEDYCVNPVATISMWVECNDDDQPALNVHITSFFPQTTTYDITWYVNDDSFEATAELGVGETYQTSTPLPVGALVDGEITYVANSSERTGVSFEDEVAPDCSTPPAGDNGGGSGNPTPTTAPRGLPTTGQASTSVTLTAALLLVVGAALIGATRRRSA